MRRECFGTNDHSRLTIDGLGRLRPHALVKGLVALVLCHFEFPRRSQSLVGGVLRILGIPYITNPSFQFNALRKSLAILCQEIKGIACVPGRKHGSAERSDPRFAVKVRTLAIVAVGGFRRWSG